VFASEMASNDLEVYPAVAVYAVSISEGLKLIELNKGFHELIKYDVLFVQVESAGTWS
jgi:hypothetical protein